MDFFGLGVILKAEGKCGSPGLAPPLVGVFRDLPVDCASLCLEKERKSVPSGPNCCWKSQEIFLV